MPVPKIASTIYVIRTHYIFQILYIGNDINVDIHSLDYIKINFCVAFKSFRIPNKPPHQCPYCYRCLAIAKPSPPLLPFPQNTATDFSERFAKSFFSSSTQAIAGIFHKHNTRYSADFACRLCPHLSFQRQNTLSYLVLHYKYISRIKSLD